MQDFNELSGAYNFPGLEVIAFAPVDNITTLPAGNSALQVEDPIVLNGITYFYAMYATVESSQLRYPQQEGEHGSFYSISVTAFIPKLELYKDQNFDSLKEQLLIVLIKDNNGNWRICGTLEAPMRFIADTSSAQQFTERNGTNVKFYGDSLQVPKYYYPDIAEVIILPPPPPPG